MTKLATELSASTPAVTRWPVQLAAKATAERTMKTSRDHQTKPPAPCASAVVESRVNVAARIVRPPA
jgi:hypothetical protein